MSGDPGEPRAAYHGSCWIVLLENSPPGEENPMLVPTSTKRLAAMFAIAVSAGCASMSPRGPTPPNDANIAAIILAANNTDISYARLAPNRAESQAVKDFAARMMTDHAAVNETVMNVLNRIRLTPEDNSTSLDFRDESTTKRDLMRDLTGRAFDSTYIANEISYHTKLLASIDRVLLPNARNPELKRTIAGIRPAVAGHLAHAEQVQARILTK
jgi:putative membrane protein